MEISFLYTALPFMAILTVGICRYLQYRRKKRPFRLVSKTDKLDKNLRVKIEHIAPIWLRFNDFEPESIKDLPEIDLDFIRSSTALPAGQSESNISNNNLGSENDAPLVVQSSGSDNETATNTQTSDAQEWEGEKKEDQKEDIQAINPGFVLSLSFTSGDFCRGNRFSSEDLFFSPAENEEKNSVSENLDGFSTVFDDFDNDDRDHHRKEDGGKKKERDQIRVSTVFQKSEEENKSPAKILKPDKKEKLNKEEGERKDVSNEKEKRAEENVAIIREQHLLNGMKADRIPVNVKPVNIKNELLVSLFRDCILPYENLFKQQNAMELTYKLLDLLDKHGDCPSVVLKQDSEGKALNPGVVNHLAKITLKQHTVHVVRFVLDELKKVYQEPEIHIPRAIVMALAHDIGKIPAFHTGDYNTLDHPLIGELQFASLAEGMDIVWKDQVRTAIREHHLNTRDQFTLILKNADRKARGIEMIQCLKDFHIVEFDGWFDLKEFVKKMVPYINVIQLNKWVAVSINGVIYVRPLFLYHLADEYRKEKKIFDSLFIYQNNKDSIVQRIVNKMKKEGIIVGLETNQYCNRYRLTTRHNLKPYYAYLVPIRLESFCVMAEVSVEEIENRKKPTYLALYTIEPAPIQKEERIFEC